MLFFTKKKRRRDRERIIQLQFKVNNLTARQENKTKFCEDSYAGVSTYTILLSRKHANNVFIFIPSLLWIYSCGRGINEENHLDLKKTKHSRFSTDFPSGKVSFSLSLVHTYTYTHPLYTFIPIFFPFLCAIPAFQILCRPHTRTTLKNPFLRLFYSPLYSFF